jgi:hypothetical protein
MSWLEPFAALLLMACSAALLLFLRWTELLDERTHPTAPVQAAASAHLARVPFAHQLDDSEDTMLDRAA